MIAAPERLFRQNVIANYAGRAWSGLMALAFIPLYIGFMGIEAYGLVGFYVTLQAVLALLDLGLSTTLNRELASRRAGNGVAGGIRDLVRTLEVAYWLIGAAIGAALALLAPVIAERWLNGGALPFQAIADAVMLMALAFALQWPYALYAGGLMGLQRQVLLNGVTIAAATLRWGGAVLVLWLVSPTIQAFFAWQVLASALHTAATGAALWRSLPSAQRPARFEQRALSRIWRFAAGMTGISAMAVVLTQLDKLILSKLLPLDAFGYYTLAAVVASGLQLLVTPIYAAAFPRFSELVAAGEFAALRSRYHQVCQLASIVVLPAAIVIACFSEEILLLWTRDPVTTTNAHALVSILAAGTALNAVLAVPYALQLAHGRTRFAFVTNVIAVAFLAPAIVWAALNHGALGAAWAWLALNCGYVLIGMPLMHRWLMPGELKRWYLADVGLPLLASIAVAVPARWWLPTQLSQLSMTVWLAAIAALTLAAAAWATPFLRQGGRTSLQP
jgi:O-antigen/teichoic acid export membrane protein